VTGRPGKLEVRMDSRDQDEKRPRRGSDTSFHLPAYWHRYPSQPVGAARSNRSMRWPASAGTKRNTASSSAGPGRQRRGPGRFARILSRSRQWTRMIPESGPDQVVGRGSTTARMISEAYASSKCDDCSSIPPSHLTGSADHFKFSAALPELPDVSEGRVACAEDVPALQRVCVESVCEVCPSVSSLHAGGGHGG
jgi:hypothetical protein